MDSMQEFPHGDAGNADIIAIQEPYIDFLRASRLLCHHIAVYPIGHLDNFANNKTRSLLLINTHIFTGSWTQLHVMSPDLTAIQIVRPFGTIWIFNIYNNCINDEAVDTTQHWMHSTAARNIPKAPLHNIWLGDFNRCHPMWDEPQNHHLFTSHNLNTAEHLITKLAELGLYMALPDSIPTLQLLVTGNHTRVDNVFCTEGLIDQVIMCNTLPEQHPMKTDHFPIIMVFDLQLENVATRERQNWKQVNWDNFKDELAQQLNRLDAPKEIEMEEEFWRVLGRLNKAVKDVIKENVPIVRPGPKQ